ncbi:MAG: hypothetical protein PVJ57_02525 [Phycisphaerae bacterium]|jgi:hypothetical protein
MIRRLVSAALLVGGLLALGRALLTEPLDQRRAVAVTLLLAVGAGLNVIGLLGSTLPVRNWLRGLAVVVGLAALAAVLGLRWSAERVLDDVSPANREGRAYVSQVLGGSQWHALGVGYATVSVLFLPPYRRSKAAPAADVPPEGEAE